MVTVAAAAIAGAAQQAVKRTSRVVVVGEYLIIELHICVAICIIIQFFCLVSAHSIGFQIRAKMASWQPSYCGKTYLALVLENYIAHRNIILLNN